MCVCVCVYIYIDPKNGRVLIQKDPRGVVNGEMVPGRLPDVVVTGFSTELGQPKGDQDLTSPEVRFVMALEARYGAMPDSARIMLFLLLAVRSFLTLLRPMSRGPLPGLANKSAHGMFLHTNTLLDPLTRRLTSAKKGTDRSLSDI